MRHPNVFHPRALSHRDLVISEVPALHISTDLHLTPKSTLVLQE